MSEQLNLGSTYEAEPDHDKYNDWILTVKDLKEKLSIYSDDTLVKLSFRGETAFGDLINVSLPIESIGGSKKFVNGERKNLIYLNGVDYG